MNFDYDNRHYSLEFNSMVIQVMGESAIGKSLMYQDLQAYINANPELGLENDFLFVNAQNKKEYTDVKRLRGYKYVVIDNADIVLTPDIDREIIESQKDSRNYWVLIGREPRGSVVGNSVGMLVHESKDGQHYFKMDYSKR